MSDESSHDKASSVGPSEGPGFQPPPGPFRAEFWRSPLRGPWFTSVLGSVLLVGIPVLALTGVLSYVAYNPALGDNDLTPGSGITRFFFAWPTSPSWLFRLNQGTHVMLGLALVPVVLAKLWSVMPKLFAWPPIRSVAHAVERLSLLFLVGGVVFEFVTGIINIQYWYIFPAIFYKVHLYGAYVFMAAFVVHVAVKWPSFRRALRTRQIRKELRIDLARTVPEPAEHGAGLVAPDPQAPTISRRGALGVVGAGSLLMFVLSVGENIGGPLRSVALLAPRGRPLGDGPNDFQVNKTAESRGITADQIGSQWRLELAGSTTVSLSRAELTAMPQHEARLAINCVEGWSTGVQRWTGVRLRDLAALVDAGDASSVFVESVENSLFSSATLRRNQILDGDSLLALQVNGVDISEDHGFPARVIVPATPGVQNTKWVGRMTFEAGT